MATRKSQRGHLLEITVVFPALCIAIGVFAVEAYRSFNGGPPPGTAFILVVLFISLCIGVLGSAGIDLRDRAGLVTSVVWGVLSIVITVAGAFALRTQEGWKLIAFEAVAMLPAIVFIFLIVDAIRTREDKDSA